MVKCGNGRVENPKKIQKDRKRYAPEALPRRRPRALTCPLPAEPARKSSWNPFGKSSPSPSQQTLDQSQSPLFAHLPIEIRRLIWSHVLCSARVLHIVRGFNTLLAIPCVEELDPGLQTRAHACGGFITGPPFQTPLGFHISPVQDHPARPTNLLPLLQTCRMIYTEAVSVLYEGNIFDIDHLDTLFYLRRSVLPRRMNQIRSLNFVWYFRTRPDTAAPPFDLNTWNEACEVVAGLSGLQDLRVHLDGHGGIQAGANWKHEWGPVLDPLMRIKPARKFDVFLPWSEEDCEEAVKGCGYQFRLCPSSSRSRDS